MESHCWTSQQWHPTLNPRLLSRTPIELVGIERMIDFSRLKRVDKLGVPFEVGEGSDDSFEPLIEMYDGFSRTDLTQGLPPSDKKARDRWVSMLLNSANNFLAWRDGKVIGHSSLIPDLGRRDAEFVIFVSQSVRNRGVGSELTVLALAKGKELGLQKVWLTVEFVNFRAIGLYHKTGFQLVDHADRERIMVMEL
jgi:RimJ/RimL family protein N-acetyltransferase